MCIELYLCVSLLRVEIVCVRPSDCSRFICLLNETRISHYSLEKPTKFSLQRGAASVSTLNGSSEMCVQNVSVHAIKLLILYLHVCFCSGVSV